MRGHHGHAQALVQGVSHRRKRRKPKKFRSQQEQARILLGNLAQVLDECDRHKLCIELHYGIVISKYGYVLPLQRGWSARTMQMGPFGDPDGKKSNLIALPAAED